MIFRFLIFVTLFYSLAACKSTKFEGDYSSSGALAFSLLDVCVHKTLNTYAELNTSNYFLDLSRITTLEKTGVDSFFRIKDAVLPLTSGDSATIFGEDGLSRSQVLKNIIVRFDEVELLENNRVYVRLSKIRSGTQILRLTLDLERQDDRYRIVKSETRR